MAQTFTTALGYNTHRQSHIDRLEAELARRADALEVAQRILVQKQEDLIMCEQILAERARELEAIEAQLYPLRSP